MNSENHSRAAGELHRRGRFVEAVAEYEAALRLEPSNAEVRCNLGSALGELGREDDAIAAFRGAIAVNPSLLVAYNNLALALTKKGRVDESIETLQAAVRAKPDAADLRNRLGEALRDAGRHAESAVEFYAAVKLAPGIAAAHNNLGTAFRFMDRIDDAITAYKYAVRVAPGFIMAHVNLGRAFAEKGLLDEANAQQQIVLGLSPNHPDAYYSLGVAFNMMGDYTRALEAHDKVIALTPEYRNVYNNRATTLRNLGRLDEALAVHAVALDRAPTNADAHLSHALTLLIKGDFARGLAEYEWRLKLKPLKIAETGDRPRWDGTPLNGKTILLQAEQGMGDTIQFIRYIPLVAALGGRIVVACPSPLMRLFGSIEPVDDWIVPPAALPAFDVECPLPSLPMTLGTTLETIPSQVPYLRVDRALAAQWHEKVAAHSPGAALRVGLVWRGNPQHGNDRNRSMSAAALMPFAGIANVHCFSLQKGGTDKPELPPAAWTDLTEDLHDFADTAALIDQLDLVITVDTSVAHLAGAMGKPVWTLLADAPDWRWLLHRDDSPWYPTMRLFRQSASGGWDGVITRVCDALAERAKLGRC